MGSPVLSRKNILIPKKLENREYYFRDSFLGEKFIKGEIRERKGQPFTTGYRQPIDFKVERLMKIEPKRTPYKLSLKIWLSDPFINNKDIASLISTAERMTNNPYNLTYDGKTKAEVMIDNADKLYPAIPIETMYHMMAKAFKDKQIARPLHITVTPSGDTTVNFSRGGWKSGTEQPIKEIIADLESELNDP